MRNYCIAACLMIFHISSSSIAIAQKLDSSTKQSIVQKRDDLRGSFDLILSLRDKKVAQEAVLFYRELWQKDENNPKIQALYAFAWTMGSAFFVYDTETATQKKYRAQLDSKNFEAYHCREDSLKKLPTAPEVLLMNAIYLYENTSNYAESLRLAEQASKLVPTWGFARYWCGKSRSSLAKKLQNVNRNAALTRAIEDLQDAEKLDTTLVSRTSIYYTYLHTYTRMEQYDKALQYMDKVIALAQSRVPQNKKEIAGLIPWRKDLVAKAKQQNN